MILSLLRSLIMRLLSFIGIYQVGRMDGVKSERLEHNEEAFDKIERANRAKSDADLMHKHNRYKDD